MDNLEVFFENDTFMDCQFLNQNHVEVHANENLKQIYPNFDQDKRLF